MAKYFSGTSTGNKYEVGKDYKTGDGRVLTAQEDGSFVKKGNFVGYTDAGQPVVDDSGRGSVSRGSYGNPDVEWYADRSGSGSAATTGIVPGQVAAAGNADRGAAPAPSGAVRVQNPWAGGSSSAMQVARVAAAGQGFGFGGGRIAPWSGLDDPEQHYMVAGWHMKASPRSSNMAMVEERQGDAEFLSPAWFASWGIAADDFVENIAVRAYGTENTWDRQHRQQVQRDFVDSAFGGALDWADEFVVTTRFNAATAAANRKVFDDAWDARERYQQQEALAGGDWTAIPELLEQNKRSPAAQAGYDAGKGIADFFAGW